MAKTNVMGYLDLDEESHHAILSLKFSSSPSINNPSRLQEYTIEVPLSQIAYENLQSELKKKEEGERMNINGALEASLSLAI